MIGKKYIIRIVQKFTQKNAKKSANNIKKFAKQKKRMSIIQDGINKKQETYAGKVGRTAGAFAGRFRSGWSTLAKYGGRVKRTVKGFSKKLRSGWNSLFRYKEGSMGAMRQQKKFRGGMLSLMFTARRLGRVLGRPINKFLKMSGIMEALNMAFMSLIAPVMPGLISLITDLIKWISGLDVGTKKFLGKLLLIGWGVSKILGPLSTLAILFGSMGVNITALISPWTLLIGVILAAAAAIVIYRDEIGNAIKKIGEFLRGPIEWLTDVWSKITNFFGNITRKIKNTIEDIRSAFKKVGKKILGGLKSGLSSWAIDLFKGASNFAQNIKDAVGEVYSAFKKLGKKILEGLKAALPEWVINLLKSRVGAGGGKGKITTKEWNKKMRKIGVESAVIEKAQEGGYIRDTGLAYLHAGETVVPADRGMTFSPTINVNASVSSDYDVRELAKKLGEYYNDELEARMLR